MINAIKIAILSFLLLIWGCGDALVQTVNKPNKLLTTKQMTVILADVYLAEAHFNQSGLTPDSLRQTAAWYYGIIEKRHGISFNDFDANLQYYISKPELLDTIYTRLVEELSNIEATQHRNILPLVNDTNKTLPVSVNP